MILEFNIRCKYNLIYFYDIWIVMELKSASEKNNHDIMS